MEVEIFYPFLVLSSQILAAGATVQILLFAMVEILYFCSSSNIDYFYLLVGSQA